MRFPILILSLVAAPVQAGTIPPPPPVVNAVADRPLVAWLPGPVQCGGQAVAPTTMRRPLTALGWSGTKPDGTVNIRFRIDADGRSASIARTGAGGQDFSQDIEPSLAATRFAAGAAREGCEITYTQRVTPLADAPVEDLISYSLASDNGPLPQAGWDRIKPQGATCIDEPRPQPLVQVLPDFRAMPATAGNRDWVMVGYDTDTRGHPINVRVLHGTGNAALASEGVKAMKKSRFTEGARTGCMFPFYRSPVTMPAPPMPAPADEGQCPAGNWATPPRLTYPESFRRRSIEGWAIIAFDAAPWGETGNIRVLAAEPAMAFGEQARQVIASARKPGSSTGATGCVERVQFRMGPGGIPAAALSAASN